MTEVVVCKNIKKTFTENHVAVEALRGVSLEAKDNELLMIMGPSGSGKTTLLSAISGIVHFDEGECYVFGNDIGKMSESEKTTFRKENLGFIFQSLYLIPTLTALENVSIPLILEGLNRKEAFLLAEHMLERFGIGHRKDTFPLHMSGGEQQRVAICRGCIHEPRLIICDEPTSNLDFKAGMKVVELIKEEAVKEGKAVILVTHDSRIIELADRLVEMEDGRIIEKPDGQVIKP